MVICRLMTPREFATVAPSFVAVSVSSPNLREYRRGGSTWSAGVLQNGTACARQRVGREWHHSQWSVGSCCSMPPPSLSWPRPGGALAAPPGASVGLRRVPVARNVIVPLRERRRSCADVLVRVA